MNKNTSNTPEKLTPKDIYEKWNHLINRLFNGMSAKERLLFVLGLICNGAIALMACDIHIPILGDTGKKTKIGFLIADSIMLSSGKYAVAAYAALVISGISSAAILRAVLLTVSFVIKLLPCAFTASGHRSVSASVTAATAYSVLSCIIFSVREGLTAATLPAALITLLLPPALSALLSGYFFPASTAAVSGSRQRAALKLYQTASNWSFLAVCILATKDHYFLGCSVAVLLVIFFSALAATGSGILTGGAVGLLLGAIYSPNLALPFCIFGLATGVFSALGITAAIGIGAAASCIAALYAVGYTAFRIWIPETIISAAIVSPIIRYKALPDGFPMPFHSGNSRKNAPAENTAAEKNTIRKQRLYSISEAFADMSTQCSFKATATHTHGISPSSAEALYHRLCHGFCDACPMVCICWNGENSIARRTVEKLISEPLSASGHRLSTPYTRIPETENFKCIKYPEFKKEVMRLLDLEGILCNPKTSEVRRDFSKDLDHVSQIIKNVADGTEAETKTDEQSTERARKSLRSLGIPYDRLTVFGERYKTVVVYGLSEKLTTTQSTAIRNALSEACRSAIGAPVFTGEMTRRAVFESIPGYTAKTACVQRKKKNESCSGDIASDFSTASGFHYSMICDGMGSGAEAAEAAGITASFTEKLLRCDISPELSAQVSGSVLRKRESECFSTLDLFAADLLEGKAVFIKSGAPASYLVRENDVKRISASTLPLGITPEADPKRIPINIKDGDTVVLVSDGITRNEEDGEWLYELLTENAEGSAGELAELIIHRAVSAYTPDGDSPLDDMTVSVTRINKCNA